ncbi:glycosyltransferase family 39 protein [Anaeromyxobacter paludicola]|uniref:Glycosyltransferase RgtA/B/C/D-like domain-containing protein n=1 Tax=Anaeromyxobacter paludicola TaxID=2918171 RepID=A0ABN6N2K0_9BACT|nr:glycosyltransferase family 39 protein [Anaeromyxobacter paludicola]BDG07437.1 hypothetical protein AMPC_05500 [Anaeromyxobacter paludicola]
MPPSARRTGLALAGITAAALVLRLVLLGRASLWLDEMWSIATARMDGAAVLSVVLHRDSNASLYYALLHGWIGLGQGEGTVRLLSALLGAATVPAVYLLGARLGGARLGLAGAALLAVNGVHVQFSQEARAYSLVILLVTLATGCFARALEAGDRRAWAGWVLAGALAVYAHVFAALALAAHGVAFLLRRRRGATAWRRLLASGAALLALLAPLALLLTARTREPTAPLGWVAPVGARSLGALLWLLAGNPVLDSSRGTAELLPGIPLALLYVALCGLALVRGARGGGEGATRDGLVLLASLAVVPALIAFGASLAKPVFVAKYLLVSMPGTALLAAVGLLAIRPGWPRRAALGVMVAVSLAMLPAYYRSRANDREWPSATAALLAGARPGDAAVFLVAPGRLLFDHYRGAPARPDPGIEVAYPPWRDPSHDPEALAYLPALPAGLADDLAARHPRVWLVLFHDEFRFTAPTARALEAELGARYPLAAEALFRGRQERVRLLLFSRTADAPAAPAARPAAAPGR